jgi:UTP--glucose-1-phosphate uridylyltransferase
MSSFTPTVATTSLVKAVVPAAGLGTRLRPLTRAIPKELLPIGREPVLAMVVAELRAAGVTRILFVISAQKPQIRAYFGDGMDGADGLPAVHFDYVVQPQQRGSGDALLCAADWVGEDPFVVAFGDCLIESPTPGAPLRRLIETHLSQGATATVLVEAVERHAVSRYGVVGPAHPIGDPALEPFALADLVEKPPVETAPSNLVVAARLALQPAVLAALRAGAPDARGELNIPDAVRPLLLAGAPCWAVPLLPGEMRRDIGNMESFLTQFVRAALRDPDYGAKLCAIAREEMQQSAVSGVEELKTEELKAAESNAEQTVPG